MNTKTYIKALLEYADYQFLDEKEIKQLEKLYKPGLSIGDLLDKIDVNRQIYTSNLKDLKKNQSADKRVMFHLQS